jgi:lactate dehydrogenase-like 2-hydroxyacid dehydrogenase
MINSGVHEPNLHENQIYKYAQESGANVILTPHIAGYAVENVKIATLGMLDYLVKAESKHPEP